MGQPNVLVALLPIHYLTTYNHKTSIHDSGNLLVVVYTSKNLETKGICKSVTFSLPFSFVILVLV